VTLHSIKLHHVTSYCTGGTFTWQAETAEPTLVDINFQVFPRELVAGDPAVIQTPILDHTSLHTLRHT
jgi:hypothetical protein